MDIPKMKTLLIGIWTLILILIPIILVLNTPELFFLRLFALYGYFMLATAATMSPFLKEIHQIFGKPFLKVHHVFAFGGLSFITLHPILYTIIQMNPTVFIPDFTSWGSFWTFAGSPALILIYLAFFGVLLKLHMKNLWRPIHGLTYLALFFGIIHANLLGTDMNGIIGLRIFYIILFGIVITAFVLKRRQQSQMKSSLLKKDIPKSAQNETP
jgi:hypothetical protein